ncbi:MAG: phage virion morphogenesis protein [Cyanomargarita calcarea GSE-NOS-MK-12-04C]|jgi:phage virion morphogenesis protein|uniref:Phage virion morphogenesis protein n=1 Tax=Cyanomargarita calcarea GSE-NOS-MK-12-04C TaxID=2839659 RepID=A0A951UR95_9CYAN|nr:phage virion morphogenesis protein [Cyanomargarita calcarea GSE-NOS-MK-12-04C]
MELSVTFDFSAITAIALRARNLDMTPPLRDASIYQEASTKVNFAKESSPDGQKWQDLKPATWLRKKSGSILREKSILVNSITHYPVGTNTWVVGTNVEYGLYHQKGVPSRNLPARTFLGFSQNDINQINQIFQRYVENIL